MRKHHAFLFACIGTLVLAFIFTSNEFHSSGRENILLSRVIDGDTFEDAQGRVFRLANINTPEKKTLGAEYATKYLQTLEGSIIEIESLGVDKYGRTLVRLYAPEYVNHELVAEGFAVKFLVHEKEVSEFAQAESEAIARERGIWNHSLWHGCVSARVDAEQEVVYLKSSCGVINITGWNARDESRKTYKFPHHLLDVSMLYSSTGTDNATAVFWKSTTNIWNNDRDTFYLFDNKGRIVSHESYGYNYE